MAVRIGFESRKDISDITVSNCVIKNTSRAIDVRTVEGGNIRNVFVSGITGKIDSGWAVDRIIEVHSNRIDNPYDIAIKEHPNFGKAKPVEKAGVIENIHFSNMHFRTSGRILVSAISEGLIDNISFENINLTYNLLEDAREIGKVAQSVGFARNLPFVRSQNATFVVENAAFFDGNEAKIKSGEMRVKYDVFAFRNAKNIQLQNTTSVNSENGAEYFSSENSIILK